MPGSDPPSLYLQILGPLRLWRDGVELDPGPRQQAYLLALLLARAGTPVSTSELIDLMWDEDVPASALNVVQKYVGLVRRVLEPGLPAREAGSYLHRRGNAYVFTADPGTLDLLRFRELTRAGDHAAAIDLWRGPAGGGIATTTIFTALDNEFYEACTAAAAQPSPPDRVLPALRLAASMAPFHEPVQASLITALGATGRQAEALALFREVRERLADELGITPSAALENAHQQVLAQKTEAQRTQTGRIPAAAAGTVHAAAAGTVQTAEAGAVQAAGAGTAAEAGALVGRVEELAVLRRTIESALAGRTAIGVVEGEPGAGKTRLLEEVAAVAATQGALVVWGSCLEGDGTPAMWPWEQALGAIVDSLPEASREQWRTVLEPQDDGPDAQFRLFERVVALVAATRRPTVVVLDDLQWADAASLRLFDHLAGRLPAGTAIVGALRDRAPEVGERLSRVLATAGRRPGHRRVRLGPLGPADVATLVRHESGHDPGDAVARTIHARSAGNPFFVLELSRLLSEAGELRGVPATVRDVVRNRMAGLDDGARDLLRVAALIGRDVDLRLLARAAGLAAADCLRRLEPLRSLGLLESAPDDPSSLRFAHDLVRESVSETEQVTRLHLRVADALEQTYFDDEGVAERLAYHLWAAGPLVEPRRTGEALIRAGRRAAAKLAFESANRHLRSAAQVARAAGLRELELSALTLLAIVVRRESGYDSSTFDLLERAEYLGRSLGRNAEAADFLFIRLMGAYTSIEEGRGRLARRMHDDGTESSDPAVRRYGLLAWGLHQWDVGDIGAAYRCFADLPSEPGEDTPLRRDGSIPGEGPGWRAVMTALHGDVGSALAFVDTWDDPGDPYAASVWVYYTTMIASMAGDAALARRAGERWVAAGLDRLRSQIDHYIRQCWCWARALTGDAPGARAAEAEELLEAGLLDPPQWGIAYHHGLIAEMWLAAADPVRASQALDRADQAIWDHGQRYAEPLLLLLRARVLLATGEPLQARSVAQRALARSTATGAHLFARRAAGFLEDLGDA